MFEHAGSHSLESVHICFALEYGSGLTHRLPMLVRDAKSACSAHRSSASCSRTDALNARVREVILHRESTEPPATAEYSTAGGWHSPVDLQESWDRDVRTVLERCRSLAEDDERPAVTDAGYPTRPVRLLVGLPAGGTADILARVVSPSSVQSFLDIDDRVRLLELALEARVLPLQRRHFGKDSRRQAFAGDAPRQHFSVPGLQAL
jgi:hypothetical protein